MSRKRLAMESLGIAIVAVAVVARETALIATAHIVVDYVPNRSISALQNTISAAR